MPLNDRHNSKYFIFINALNLHKTLVGKYDYQYHFIYEKTVAQRGQASLLKVTQPVGGRAGTQSLAVWFQSLCFYPQGQWVSKYGPQASSMDFT